MIEIHDCEQGSERWYKIRAGRPTASEFSSILAKGEGKTRRSYLYRLAGEIITGEPSESFQSAAMERGKAMEAEAREQYAFDHDADPVLVGFISNGPKGCSPDALLGDNGLLEIKTKRADLLIEALFREDLPPEHRAQCQGALWVAEREFVDLCVYWPKMPLMVRRAYRDEVYIRALSEAVDAFNEELALTVQRVRAYGVSPAEIVAAQLSASVSQSSQGTGGVSSPARLEA